MEVSYPALMKFWKDWGLRSMVLLSLLLQVVLVILGKRRKSHRETLTRVVVWSAYMAADSVATFALGLISSNLTEIYQENDTTMDNNIQLTAFWAPFLLLHMGGPDTITAYALEDNQLWLRHLLGLAVQTAIAIYIMVMAWRPSSSQLSTLSITMFFAGLIKYAERTWSLRSASNEKFKKRVVNSPSKYHRDTGWIDRHIDDKITDGFIVQADRVTDIAKLPVSVFDENSISKDEELLTASGSMKVPLGLFSDAMLTSGDKQNSRSIFRNISSKSAFRIVDIQLGFIYDLFYTKAPLLSTFWGICLRPIPFFLTCFVLVLYSINFLNHSPNRNEYSDIDVYTTLVLVIVAISVEIYATLVHLFSDRFLVWLKKHHYRNIPYFLKQVTTTSRWSNKLPQYRLRKGMEVDQKWFCKGILKLIVTIHKELENMWYISDDKDVPEEMKDIIFRYFKAKVAINEIPFSALKTNHVSIRKSYDLPGGGIKESLWPSIITWHFATEIMYHEDKEKFENNQIYEPCKWIVWISRYMLYLLIEYPSMVSAEMGLVQFQYTRQHAWRRHRINAENKLPGSWFALNNEVDAEYGSGSLLDCARDIYIEIKKQDNIIERWNTVSCAWLEILTRAASRCPSNQHAQQLRRGGEFLTHVWLLMAHFGLTNHYQIQESTETYVLVMK